MQEDLTDAFSQNDQREYVNPIKQQIEQQEEFAETLDSDITETTTHSKKDIYQNKDIIQNQRIIEDIDVHVSPDQISKETKNNKAKSSKDSSRIAKTKKEEKVKLKESSII